MSKNKTLIDFYGSKTLFVMGDNYSQFSLMFHIEAEPIGLIFQAVGKKYQVVKLLSEQFEYQASYLVDQKFHQKFLVDKGLPVYNTKLNTLSIIPITKIQQYLDAQPKNPRHWLLLVDKDNPLIKIAIKLMPRLAYAL